MGRTLVGGKPGGGDPAYNARHINFELRAMPTLQEDGEYYIVSDVPYDPVQDLIVGLLRYDNRTYACEYRYAKYQQSDWYGRSKYEWVSSIGGKLACPANGYSNTNQKDFRAYFDLIIYRKT